MAHQESQIDYVEFPAKNKADLELAKDFYGAVFQWQFQDWGDDCADTSGSGLGSGLNSDPSHRPAKPLAIIYSVDLEAARRRVVEAGGTVTREIFAFPGGRRFHFKDPADNELGIWSDQPSS